MKSACFLWSGDKLGRYEQKLLHDENFHTSRPCLGPCSSLVLSSAAFAQTGSVGIGTTSPDAKLHAVGDTHLEGGQRVKVLVVTANLTLDATHYAVVANSASGLTVTLPAASAHAGRKLIRCLATLMVASLRAQTSPTITGQPSPVTEGIGGNVAFMVSAAGTPPLAYQWRKDGTSLTGAIAATLFLPAITTTQAGAYSCVVTNAAGSTASAAAALTAVGSLAPRSAVDSTFVVSPPIDFPPRAVAVQADGKVVVGGYFLFLNEGIGQYGLARLNNDGSFDTSFKPPAALNLGAASVLAVQVDGKILVTSDNIPLTRLNADGSRDAAFSSGLTVRPTQILPLADGKILLIDGTTKPTRLNADGTTDATFTRRAFQITVPINDPGAGFFNTSITADATLDRLTQLPDGRFLAVGYITARFAGDFPPFALLVCYNADGTPDASFVTGDPVRISTAPNIARALRVLADGRIMLVLAGSGWRSNGIETVPAVRRFNADGSHDASYSTTIGRVAAAAVAADGHVLFSADFTSVAGVSRNKYARLKADGSLDLSYALGTVASADNRVASLLVPLDDGRALAIGDFVSMDGIARRYLVRLTATTLDGANPPVILPATPGALATRAGESISFAVFATGSPPLTYALTAPDGSIAVSATSSATITFTNPQTSGSYRVTVTGVGGAIATASVTVSVASIAPFITKQPAALQTNTGRPAMLAVETIGSDPRTYQWFKDGNPVATATSATFAFASTTAANSGDYTLVVRNSLGLTTSQTVHLGVDETSRLANISTRALADAGEKTLIAGFVVAGPGTKTVLVRGIGPALAPFGVAGTLANPKLALFDGTAAKLAENDDWGTPANPALAAAFGQAGAFALPAGSLDAALVQTLPPGSYTAQLTGVGGTSGVGLIEVYEADAQSSRLINLSSRAYVGAGAGLAIGGLSVQGPAPRKLLIRSIGPSLAQFGVTGTLADPVLTLVDNNGATVTSNDDWGGGSPLTNAFATVGAFALPATSKDAALLVTLAPGNYTALVSGAGNMTGVALVEIYEVP